MRSGFRQSMAWLHTWGGLVVGWILYFVFVTGTLGYLDTEIDRWARPEVAYDTVSEAAALEAAVSYLNETAADADRWFIAPPTTRERAGLYVYWSREHPGEGQAASGYQYLDATTARPVVARDTSGGQTLYRMHWSLHYIPRLVGEYIVGLCAMFMLVAIVTGVIIHKKIFKDFFTFRPRRGQRSWLDFHNVLSVIALPFHLMITYSGLVFYTVTYMPLIVAGSYGTGPDVGKRFYAEAFPDTVEVAPVGVTAPLTAVEPVVADIHAHWGARQIRFVDIDHPNDANARITVTRVMQSPSRSSESLVYDGSSGQRLKQVDGNDNAVHTVRDTLYGLHEGLFAGPALRGFYVLSGLAGTAMIATGLILWTVKRRGKQLAQAGGMDIGYQWVEKLNIGTVVGLPLGIAAFFWANRLLPLGMAERAEWELHSLFIAWGLMLVHAFVRPWRAAWIEALVVTALAFCLLPVVNALTTERDLLTSLGRGDWVFVGFDLAVLATGLLFAVAAVILRRRFVPDVSSAGFESLGRQEAVQ